MYLLTISSLLRLTAGIIGLELILFAFLLTRRNLFRWTTTGFWAWSAFLLYYVLAPFAITFREDALYNAQIRLAYSGGIDRGLWILLMAVLGIAVFFIFYMRTKFKTVTWGLSTETLKITPPKVLILTGFISFGLYSLLAFRAGLISGAGDVLIVGSRFQGNVTGYQYIGYMFLFVPIVLFMLSKDFALRSFGWVIMIGFVVLSVPHAWSRYATVSMIVAFSLITVVQKKQRWPSIVWLAALFFVAVIFQLRGHVEWDYENIGRETAQLVSELPQRGVQILSSSDTSMLPSWYVSSSFYDTWVGYDYGLPMLNSVLTGWIPNRFFPQKYFIIDWLRTQQGSFYPIIMDRLLYGAKSSLLGSFYAHGGWIGVLIGGMFAGYLSRRLDGMLAEETSILVKSVAISWLSVLWMIWGSGTTWGVMNLGAMALPALVVWLSLPKRNKKYLPSARESAPPVHPRDVLSKRPRVY